MMKKLLFLDFDGVLNPLTSQMKWVGEGEPTPLSYIYPRWGDWVVEAIELNPAVHFVPDRTGKLLVNNGNEHPFAWSSELVDRINNLIDNGGVDVWYATGWLESSNQISEQLGLHIPANHFVNYNTHSDISLIKKTTAVVDSILAQIKVHGEKNVKAVYVDDNFDSSAYYVDKILWGEDISFSPGYKEKRRFFTNNIFFMNTDEHYGVTRENWKTIVNHFRD